MALVLVGLSGYVVGSEDNSGSHDGKVYKNGLWFDVEEGVEFEQAGGGSLVIQKSNREYTKSKFDNIEERLNNFESRIKALEDKAAGTAGKSDERFVPSQDRRVLSS